MGADIFSWVEKFDADTGKWTAVRGLFPAGAAEQALFKVTGLSAPFRERNYALFAVLAGVRNDFGITPIAQPRGLPPDCDLKGGCAVIDETELCQDLRPISPAELMSEFYSHSFLLLSELLNCEYELGTDLFAPLERMRRLGPASEIRVVFCFQH